MRALHSHPQFSFELGPNRAHLWVVSPPGTTETTQLELEAGEVVPDPFLPFRGEDPRPPAASGGSEQEQEHAA